MSKLLKKILLCILICGGILIYTIYCITISLTPYDGNLKYQRGKDTYLIVGDGTFQIGRFAQKPSSIEESKDVVIAYSLIVHTDKYKIETIEEYSRKYLIYKDKLYVIGDSGYTIVDYRNNSYEHYKDLSQFTNKEQEVFEKEKFKNIK